RIASSVLIFASLNAARAAEARLEQLVGCARSERTGRQPRDRARARARARIHARHGTRRAGWAWCRAVIVHALARRLGHELDAGLLARLRAPLHGRRLDADAPLRRDLGVRRSMERSRFAPPHLDELGH